MEEKNNPNEQSRYCLKGQSDILKQNMLLMQINEVEAAIKSSLRDPFIKDYEEYYLLNSNLNVPENILRRSPRLLIRHYGLEEYFQLKDSQEEDTEEKLWLQLRHPDKNPDVADAENYYIDNPDIEPPKWLLNRSSKIYAFVQLSKDYDVKLLQDFIRYKSPKKVTPVNPHKEEHLGKLKTTIAPSLATSISEAQEEAYKPAPTPISTTKAKVKDEAVDAAKNFASYIVIRVVAFALILVVFSLVAWGCDALDNAGSNLSPDPDQNLIEQSMPITGFEFYSSASFENNANCPFTIETANSDTDAYYIKILDAYTKQLVYGTFIRPGETLDITVPDGDYIVRYACGEKWYGEHDLFGSKTYCSEFDDIFYFYTDSDGYNGYTVELYKQANGNLSETYLDVEDF